jgi:predicted aldo/keto reductase-like oxidoreductase
VKFRKFYSLDWEVSVLGFGAMRLPVNGKDASSVDEPEAIKMIRQAVDQGVNYIDIAYTYHDKHGEIVVGKALLNGYRKKVKLATKLPSWLVEKPDVKKTALREFQYLNNSKRRMPCWLRKISERKFPWPGI